MPSAHKTVPRKQYVAHLLSLSPTKAAVTRDMDSNKAIEIDAKHLVYFEGTKVRVMLTKNQAMELGYDTS